MSESKYKSLSIVLGFLAVLFAILYFTKPAPSISETYSELSEEAATCQADLANWQESYQGDTAVTGDGKEELNSILENCKEVLTATQERL